MKTKDLNGIKENKSIFDLNMFRVEHTFNPTDGSTAIRIGTSKNIVELMEFSNVKNEYSEYIEDVSKVIEGVSKQINDLTINFAIKNLSDGTLKKEKSDIDGFSEKLLSEVFK